MKLLFENWRNYITEEAQQIGDFTVVARSDGKLVLIHKTTFEHIGTHQKPGVGSVFSGNITPEIIIKEAETANIPDTGGFVTAHWPGAGYELVKPMEWIKQNLPDAKFGVAVKQDFDPVKKKPMDVSVVAAKTTKPITDFPAEEVSVGIFKYDPARSTEEQNVFVKNTPALASALQNGKLFSLATAFPGGFEIEGQKVPKVTGWGGTDPEHATWAVIVPGNI